MVLHIQVTGMTFMEYQGEMMDRICNNVAEQLLVQVTVETGKNLVWHPMG